MEDENDLAIISIVKEVVKKSNLQYRIIVRTKQVHDNMNEPHIILVTKTPYINRISIWDLS